ncbi:unnamed protein product, partial [Trifolium pratense]
KCERLADREKIITNGPWMLFDHYLAVARWTPDFASPHAKVEKTLVWIRFPGLNLLYYDESVLLGLASVVGTPVKVDTNTLSVERGRFARICVEIDLTLPVVGKVNVNGHWYNVQYEGLHIICGGCGCYGHHTRDCTKTTMLPNKKIAVVATQGGAPVGDARREKSVSEPNKESGADNLETNAAKINVVHGDWLVVQRRKKNNKKNNPSQPSSSLETNRLNDIDYKKGKESSTTLKGLHDNNVAGVGPNRISSSTKKRRLDKSGSLETRHFSRRQDPHTKDKTGPKVGPNVDTKTKAMVGPSFNFGPNAKDHMQTVLHNPNSTSLNLEPATSNSQRSMQEKSVPTFDETTRLVVMGEGSTQEDERIPESPIDWESVK